MNITDTSAISALGDGDAPEAGQAESAAFDSQGTLLSLDPDAVQGMMDADNALFVQGDAGDAVALLGNWTKAAKAFVGDDGQVYDPYVAQTSDGTTVTLYLDQDVTAVS